MKQFKFLLIWKDFSGKTKYYWINVYSDNKKALELLRNIHNKFITDDKGYLEHQDEQDLLRMNEALLNPSSDVIPLISIIEVALDKVSSIMGWDRVFVSGFSK